MLRLNYSLVFLSWIVVCVLARPQLTTTENSTIANCTENVYNSTLNCTEDSNQNNSSQSNSTHTTEDPPLNSSNTTQDPPSNSTNTTEDPPQNLTSSTHNLVHNNSIFLSNSTADPPGGSNETATTEYSSVNMTFTTYTTGNTTDESFEVDVVIMEDSELVVYPPWLDVK